MFKCLKIYYNKRSIAPQSPPPHIYDIILAIFRCSPRSHLYRVSLHGVIKNTGRAAPKCRPTRLWEHCRRSHLILATRSGSVPLLLPPRSQRGHERATFWTKSRHQEGQDSITKSSPERGLQSCFWKQWQWQSKCVTSEGGVLSRIHLTVSFIVTICYKL